MPRPRGTRSAISQAAHRLAIPQAAHEVSDLPKGRGGLDGLPFDVRVTRGVAGRAQQADEIGERRLRRIDLRLPRTPLSDSMYPTIRWG